MRAKIRYSESIHAYWMSGSLYSPASAAVPIARALQCGFSDWRRWSFGPILRRRGWEQQPGFQRLVLLRSRATITRRCCRWGEVSADVLKLADESVRQDCMSSLRDWNSG